MKFFGKFNVPTETEVVAGLELDSDGAVIAARAKLAEERTAADQARLRMNDACVAVTDAQAAIAAGQARSSKLEAALVARQAAALVLPEHAPRVAAAERALEMAIGAAKVRIVAEAGKRRDKLQRVADELRPTLEALREAEAALDAAVEAVRPGGTVVPLEWPSTLDDDGARRNARFHQANAPHPAA